MPPPTKAVLPVRVLPPLAVSVPHSVMPPPASLPALPERRAPLSRLLVTVSVLGIQRCSSASSVGRKIGRLLGDACRFGFCDQEVNHIMYVLSGTGQRWNEGAVIPDAQTERRGGHCLVVS